MSLYAATIALSAFLLFLIQPIIARQILPWFGGSAAVWTTCLVFFQLLLLFGYAYSDWIIRRLPRKRQARLHTILLVTSLAWLPIAVPEALKPVDASLPAGRILMMLATTIGLPYLMLATTGPLIQAWFARRYQGARVYRLYALSNIASMAALIAYPPLIEPNASGHAQTIGWSIGYALFVGLAIAAAWSGRREGLDAPGPASLPTTSLSASSQPTPPLVTAPSAHTSLATSPVTAASTATPLTGPSPTPTPAVAAEPSAADLRLWLVLSALGSVMLLAITTHITQNIASIPFLWVLPLAIYLLTFILCFDGTGWYWRRTYSLLAALFTFLLLAGLSFRLAGDTVERGILNLEFAVPLYATGLFVCCMYLHGELVARKPAPEHLTTFYLMVSLGGAIGGLLIGVVAPVLASWYWELPIALVVIASLIALLSRDWTLRAIGLLAAFGCAALLFDYVRHIRGDAVVLSRNFYGTLRVNETTGADGQPLRRSLLHGVILHGDQYFDGDARRQPTTYYGRQSGIGRTLETLHRSDVPLRVAMVGAGTGTLTTYGRPDDVFRLYELNPAVFALADRWFTYLQDSPAHIERVTGDARLMMEREADQRFDVLAIDAFSSDAIPIHLITREALALYRRHLSARGTVLFHVSNRYLDLTGIVARLAADAGMTAVQFSDSPTDDARTYHTDWIAVTGNAEVSQRLVEAGGKVMGAAAAAAAPLWTDDHHNLFEVLY